MGQIIDIEGRQSSPDVYSAARVTLRRIGGPEEIGPRLFPHLQDELAAERRICDVINPRNHKKFDLQQTADFLRLARQGDCHELMGFLCAYAGYQPPQPIEPLEELGALLRAFNHAEQAQAGREARIQALMEQHELDEPAKSEQQGEGA